MALDGLPGAARRDAHFLVVVANRATRGKRVAKPETIVGRDAVGNVGKAGRPLVRRDHQIGVVGVVAHHLGRWHNGALDQVVSQIKQAAKKELVAGHALGQRGFTIAGQGRILQHKASFGTHRDDDRILDVLGLHQTQNFGAEIFAPVRPAKAAARHLAVAQMNAFDTR